jgi:membrane dipeptidase
MILVDGHLDIAFNYRCYGRDPRGSALEIREREGEKWRERMRGRCMVGLPELRAGRVAVVFSTIYLPRRRDWEETGRDPSLAYSNAEEAEALALEQLEFYRALSEEGGGFRLVGDQADLAEVLSAWEGGAVGDIGLVPLMEGADPIRGPETAAEWFERGLRIVGLSWRGTRYAGGTGEPGPLSAAGRDLVPALEDAGLILDLSHAAAESFWEELELFGGTVIASHSNPRALRAGDRQLSDAMIRAISERRGVIGVVPFNRMLAEDWPGPEGPSVTIARVAEAIDHVAQTAGTHEAVAIGSDFDGGFGSESTPSGIDTVADLGRLADVLADLGFADETILDVLGLNWIRLLERSLPAA